MIRWSPSANVGYQTCHVLASWAISAQCRAWGWSWWEPIVAVVSWVAVKEFGFDLIVEKDSVAGSARDAKWYGVGLMVGMAIQWMT